MVGLSNQKTLNSQHRESNHIKTCKCLPKELRLLLYMLPCQGQMFPSVTNNRGIYENDIGVAMIRSTEHIFLSLKAVYWMKL